MVLLRSMLLHPSVLAPMLLLLVVCLICLPKPGHSKCKRRVESEGNKIHVDGVEECLELKEYSREWRCAAIFCTSAVDNLMWNEWGCYTHERGKSPPDEQTCASNRTKDIRRLRIERNKFTLAKWANRWECKCQIGSARVEMSNTNFVNPNPALRPTTTTTTPAPPKMKCKYRGESEDGELNEKLNKEEEKECENNEMKCGLLFCKANDGELVWNRWNCFPADWKKKMCAEEASKRVNERRAEWSASTLANATTDWKCRCRFGANGTDMSNAKFVPSSAPVPTTIRHGNGGGMALMMIGLIIAFLPLFHAASLMNC
ncbi:hypothetical protein niasHT_039999 [Heterodera trifolii]|uniref:Uncharacterized protein n=1 Tax=Heterodera trifolii TaxID=157864 RepID=A0ABD2J4W8_9BILA